MILRRGYIKRQRLCNCSVISLMTCLSPCDLLPLWVTSDLISLTQLFIPLWSVQERLCLCESGEKHATKHHILYFKCICQSLLPVCGVLLLCKSMFECIQRNKVILEAIYLAITPTMGLLVLSHPCQEINHVSMRLSVFQISKNRTTSLQYISLVRMRILHVQVQLTHGAMDFSS